MKISFCIICYDRDAFFLPCILKELEKQTVAPDEILIVASGIKNKNYLSELGVNISDPKLTIHTLEERAMPNRARNMAAELATGEVVCISDVDDTPHPQKVELVKEIFKNKDVDALVHNYFLSRGKFSEINIQQAAENIEKVLEKEDPPSTNVRSEKRGDIAHGHLTGRKSVFKDVKGPEDIKFGEDGKFCQSIVDSNHNFYYTSEKLIIYVTK